MTVRDNVIALRKIYHADTLVQHIIHSAAAEIERLREEAGRFRAERDAARREVCRDEACRPSPSPPCTARQVAMQRGWDCFKENA